ncbi:MAG: enoyl-CoA hydratase/isomerase family protein [Deltaproteobacteria bacterium]|nr:enoyl-CoA hydratase/isomerase family protein [Deltaproteobacteria bacterium]
MSELVTWEKQNGVAYISLNSPPANAMSVQLLQEFDAAVQAVGNDAGCRAVLIKSSVPKIFMAGADLKYLLGLNEQEFREYIANAQKICNRVEGLPKPTIAVLSGHALGGGCELALSCDFRYMADSKALIGVPEVTLGLLPGAGGTQRLPRLIGRGKATELLFRGNTLQGPEALSIGLVDKVFPQDQLLPEAVKLAEELARGATQAIARIKRCLRAPGEESLAEGLAQELDGIAYLFVHTDDTKEGIRAFSEKRRPTFAGK